MSRVKFEVFKCQGIEKKAQNVFRLEKKTEFLIIIVGFSAITFLLRVPNFYQSIRYHCSMIRWFLHANDFAINHRRMACLKLKWMTPLDYLTQVFYVQSNIRSMQKIFFSKRAQCAQFIWIKLHMTPQQTWSSSIFLRIAKVFTVIRLKNCEGEQRMHVSNNWLFCVHFTIFRMDNQAQSNPKFNRDREIKPNDYTQTRERQQRMVATKWGLESGNLATKTAKPYALSSHTATNDTEIAIFFPAASRFYKFESRQYVDTVYTRLNAMCVWMRKRTSNEEQEERRRTKLHVLFAIRRYQCFFRPISHH